MMRTLFSATILVGVLAGTAMAQAPNAGCALPSEPWAIPAALDAAISGPADKDRACMKALLMPEARMMFVSLGADGTPSGPWDFLPHCNRMKDSYRDARNASVGWGWHKAGTLGAAG